MADQYKKEDIAELNAKLEAGGAEETIKWAVSEFGEELTFASSFGAEDMVVLDMLLREDADANVFILDTGRLPQETYDVIDAARKKYRRNFIVYAPDNMLLEDFLAASGMNSFYRSAGDRRECCRIRKTEPLGRALEGVAAWMTGLRREQSVTRTSLRVAELDEGHGGILKLNPLADWTQEMVWEYIKGKGLPYNALHDRGYPSIGCAPCTRAVEPGADIRSGRWWWEDDEHKECGLHPAKG